MKKFIFPSIFLLLLWNAAVAQQEKTVVCYPFPAKLGISNGLGTISYTTLAGERVGPYETFGFTVKMGVGWKLSGETLRGFAKFDISEIPKNADIQGLKIHAESGPPSRDPNHRIEIHQMQYDPDEINEAEYQDWLWGDAAEKEKHTELFNTMAKIYNDCGNGPLYTAYWDGATKAVPVSRPLTPDAEKDLQKSLSRGWFAIGFVEEGEDSKYGNLSKLNLEVRYTLPQPKPDLTISECRVETEKVNPATGLGRILIFLTTKNIGERQSQGAKFSFLVDDTEVVHNSLPDMRIGYEYQTDFLYYELKPGSHILKVILDPANEIEETDETNNEWREEYEILETTQAKLPDLAVESLEDEDVEPSWHVPYGKWNTNPSSACLISHESVGSSPTWNQTFIWQPSTLDNFIINTSFVVNAQGSHSRIGIVANTEGGLVENDRKWCLIIDDGYLKLLEENVLHRAKIPFHISLGERYEMRMLINGNFVKGKIWQAGQNEPDWMVEDIFKGPYNKFGIGLESEASMTCFKEFYTSRP